MTASKRPKNAHDLKFLKQMMVSSESHFEFDFLYMK